MQTHNHNIKETAPLVKSRTLSSGVKLAVYNADANNINKRKAALSVSIKKGHFDAQGYPEGFAHLLEHMLFNASNSYQKKNDLDQHLQAFHGQTNGWTEDRFTYYQLSCDPLGFEKACHILIDRLCRPLFAISDIEQEIAAIDAEFKLKMSEPVRQLLSVQKATCSQQHPFSLFSTGNKLTLGALSTQKVQVLLQQFHQEMMQGEHVCICIALPNDKLSTPLKESSSSASSNNVAQIIDEGFKSIVPLSNEHSKAKNNPIRLTKKLQRNSAPAFYDNEHLNTLIQVYSPKKHHQVMVSYILKNIDKSISDSLFVMLTHLIESKHKHSLHDVLINKGYIQDLHSYYKYLDANTSELIVSINLTDSGTKEYLWIMRTINAFMKFIEHKGIEKWRLREKASQYALQANLQGQSSLLEHCITISKKMHEKNIHECNEPETFNIEDTFVVLPGVLKQLIPANRRCYFVSPLAQTNQTTEHLATPYAISKFPTDASILSDDESSNAMVLNKNQESPSCRQLRFEMPRQNPFMVGEHKMVSKELLPTDLVTLSSPQISLKFYQDTSFDLPNGECYLSITDPNMHESTQKIAIKRVWIACLNEYLAIRFFDVELASLHFRVYSHHHGITIHTSGLSEKQLLLCIELINMVKSFKASHNAIKRHIAGCIDRVGNNLQQKPFNQMFAYLNEYYQDPEKTNKNIFECLQTLSVEDVETCQNTYFQGNFLESLLLGNWQLKAVERFFAQLNSRFNANCHVNDNEAQEPYAAIKPASVAKPSANQHQLTSSKHIHFEVAGLEEHNVIWHIVPNNKETPQKLVLAARSLVLEKLLGPISFEVLRQTHSMGYMLGVGYKPIGGFPGIAIYLLSPSHSLNDIMSAMHEIIDEGIDLLSNQPEILKHLVKELIKQVTPKERDIGQRTTRAWMHFEDSNPLLSFNDLVSALQALTVKEIIDCLRGCISGESNSGSQNTIESASGQILMTQSAETLKDVSKISQLQRFQCKQHKLL